MAIACKAAVRAPQADLPSAPIPIPRPTLRRAQSLSHMAEAFLDCCTDRSPKTKLYCRTSDDCVLPMPPSWKHTAFTSAAGAAQSTRPLRLPPFDLSNERDWLLYEANDSVGKYQWVKNDESPWGTLGGRSETGGGTDHPLYHRRVNGHAVFHNTFRAWLDGCGSAEFSALPDTASMNCSDFVALCMAKALRVTPRQLARAFNTQSYECPQPVRWNERFNVFGAAFRQPIDCGIQSGDIVFWENASGQVSHVAVLNEMSPWFSVVQLSNMNDNTSVKVSDDRLIFEDLDKMAYVTFDTAARCFTSHVNNSQCLEKSLRYETMLKLLPGRAKKASRSKA